MMNENEREPLINRQNKQEQSKRYTEVNSNNNNNEGYEENTEFQQIDGGYGWIVCLATFWCFGIIIGMDYNYSLIYNKLVIVYNTTENHVIYAGKYVNSFLLKQKLHIIFKHGLVHRRSDLNVYFAFQLQF
jgi:hypothetical protein